MGLKYESDGWTRWMVISSVSIKDARGMVNQLMFSREVDWVSTGILVTPRIWEFLMVGDVEFRSEGEPTHCRIRKPKGLATLEESVYNINITGDTETKLLEGTK